MCAASTLSRRGGCTHWVLVPLWPLGCTKRRAASVAVESGRRTERKIDAGSGKWRQLFVGDEGEYVSTVRNPPPPTLVPLSLHLHFTTHDHLIEISTRSIKCSASFTAGCMRCLTAAPPHVFIQRGNYFLHPPPSPPPPTLQNGAIKLKVASHPLPARPHYGN